MGKAHFKKFVLAAALTVIGISTASAHTTSLGYVPAATSGSVTLWAGHYNHSGLGSAEGTGLLVGVTTPYSSGTIPFTIGPVATKPAGLIDGTNNFFWTSSSTGGYVYGSGTDPNLFGPIVGWEGITFTGLVAGTYDFTISDDIRTTQEWQNLSPGSVRLTLTGADIGLPTDPRGTVPEPTTVALLGLGLLGVAVSRRKSAKSKNA